MDSIKKKMEKLSTETQMAEQRISQYEEIKLKNELEAEKFEEQLRYSIFSVRNFNRLYFLGTLQNGES